MLESISTFLHSSAATLLAKSLLHSLWQAALIGLIFYGAQKVISPARCSARYKMGFVALLAVIGCWLGTLSLLNQNLDIAATPLPRTAPATPAVSVQSTTLDSAPVRPAISAPPAEPAMLRLSKKSNRTIYSGFILLWMTGVAAMLLRLCVALTGAQSHRKKANPIADPELIARFKKIEAAFSVPKKILFAATATLKSPCVIGVLKPIILIPTAMLTGTPSADLEVIVAHELAHIRRADYLHNLLQMIIESLFFFNPAVWWISHRIRLEREICCDTEAMKATGQRVEYAELLFQAYGGNSATAMAFGSNHKTSALERVQRILRPNSRLDVKIGAVRLVLLLSLTALSLIALAKTSDLAVEAVAKMMTPKERVEKLQALAEKTETDDRTAQGVNEYGEKEITISGVVKTEDGTPIPKDARIDTLSYNPKGRSSGYSGIRVTNTGHFEKKVLNQGVMIVSVNATGYAPAFSPPLTTATAGKIENIELVLNQGFPLNLRIIDEKGAPIRDAKIDFHYIHRVKEGNYPLIGKSIESDSKGISLIEHATEHEIELNVEADGFQPVDRFEAYAQPGKPINVVMKKGLIAKSIVVDKETGAPIPNATFRLMYRNTPRLSCNYGQNGKDAGASAADGRISFNTWTPDTTYTFIVEAAGHSPVRLEKVDANTFPTRIELGTERIIRGTVIGDLDKLKSVYDPFNHYRSFRKGFTYTNFNFKDGKRDHSSQMDGVVEVVIKDGVGHFELNNLVGPETWIFSSGKKIAILSHADQYKGNIEIDLDSTVIIRNGPHREIVFAFEVPDGLPAPEGTINIMVQRTAEANFWTPKKVTVKNGIGRASFETPTYIQLDSSHNLAGYWVKESSSSHSAKDVIIPGPTPLRITYQANPCGGIAGRIMDHNGNLASGMECNIFSIYSRPSKQSGETMEEFRARSATMPILSHKRPKRMKSGAFSFTSLPIGQTYVVIAEFGLGMTISEKMAVTEENPIPHITIRLPEPTTISGRVLNPDGTHATNLRIRLDRTIKVDDVQRGWGNSGTTTDENGAFIFEGILPHPFIDYSVKIEAEDVAGLCPINQIVEPGKEVIIQLKKALSLKGRVLDHETGRPRKGIMVSTTKLSELYDIWEISTETDSSGNFSFSTLSKGEYAISVPSMEITSPATTNKFFATFTAGEVDFLELRVKPMTNLP